VILLLNHSHSPDPHIPDNQRRKLYEAFQDAKPNYQWHEFNANHSFMMDDDGKGRYDPAVAALCYTLLFDLFDRNL
jgi:carboxymethylenebutenolidase